MHWGPFSLNQEEAPAIYEREHWAWDEEEMNRESCKLFKAIPIHEPQWQRRATISTPHCHCCSFLSMFGLFILQTFESFELLNILEHPKKLWSTIISMPYCHALRLSTLEHCVILYDMLLQIPLKTISELTKIRISVENDQKQSKYYCPSCITLSRLLISYI